MWWCCLPVPLYILINTVKSCLLSWRFQIVEGTNNGSNLRWTCHCQPLSLSSILCSIFFLYLFSLSTFSSVKYNKAARVQKLQFMLSTQSKFHSQTAVRSVWMLVFYILIIGCLEWPWPWLWNYRIILTVSTTLGVNIFPCCHLSIDH